MRPQTTRKVYVFADAAVCKIWRRLYVKQQRSYFLIESLLPQLQLNEKTKKKEKEKNIERKDQPYRPEFLTKVARGKYGAAARPTQWLTTVGKVHSSWICLWFGMALLRKCDFSFFVVAMRCVLVARHFFRAMLSFTLTNTLFCSVLFQLHKRVSTFSCMRAAWYGCLCGSDSRHGRLF